MKFLGITVPCTNILYNQLMITRQSQKSFYKMDSTTMPVAKATTLLTHIVIFNASQDSHLMYVVPIYSWFSKGNHIFSIPPSWNWSL